MRYSYFFKIFVFLFSAVFIISAQVRAQKKNSGFRYHIRKTTSPVVIDGKMQELAWDLADSTSEFYMSLPMDTSLANVRTQVRMTYDDKNIYIIVHCYNKLAGPYMVESLKRDFSFVKNDNFIFFMDPFDARTDGFSFGANAAGAQWDGSMYEGGKVDLNWDTKWISAISQDDIKWVWEAAIPFKSIRYKKGINEWGINFSRNDLKTTEKSAWAPVPRQFPTAALAYTGTLVWDTAPPAAGTNVSIIPYVLGAVATDHINNKPTDYRYDIGGDAKIAVTSSLNLDLTVNPDFSQVDVDQQVINLNRFELFFPEKRQFFLENGDLFNNFGYQDIRPFFSRRIGLNAPIQFGARLTGKINKQWRVGIMDLQTGHSNTNDAAAQNFGVVTLQRRVFSRSNIGFIFINKQATETWKSTSPSANYNRTAGLEYNLASSNNLWTGKLLALKSFTPDVKSTDQVVAGHLQYLSKYWTIYLQHQYVGKNYNAEVGYIPRSGFNKISPLVLHNFFPKSGSVLSHGVQILSNYYFDENFNKTDNESTLSYILTFRNRTVFTLSGINSYVKLLKPFDPTNTGAPLLPVGFENHWNSVQAQFVSKPQSLLTYLFDAIYGGYYNHGKRVSTTAQVGYRFQPFVNIALNANYIDLKMPSPYDHYKFWLIGPRIDVTFTKTLYFTAFVQYNEQIKNVNVNTRLQWRYKPASDLFIVYGDNFDPSPFTSKSRQFVLKWTYWWNV
ncbi:carbohydrate binding family 9 domain-containing protein [Flavitalea sp.]|nr:DUF5916 domain-containing protein [Flavitalea sp.]